MLDKIRIVMVETQIPGNIGAAARAMWTMGLSNLVLVNPHDFPAQKAIWRSAGAKSVVENARVVTSLEEAIDDCSLVIAASARQRRIPWPMLSPEQAGQKVAMISKTDQVAIVFGREDRGLINEELQLCNFHSAIPANEEYPVLNVAAAVQVFCYEVRKNVLALTDNKVIEDKGGESPCAFANWDEAFATHEDVERFYAHLEQVLVDIDFHNPENPRQLMTRLRRLFNRSQLDVMELNILRGILTAVEKARK
jgi:tRNA (cytidine32/uridine32-2'-O)-methyltransferase